MTQLIECIPNFSEARRPEIVDQILEEIISTSGVTLLDHSSDKDHNRTVVTFVGSPTAVEEAAYRAIVKAAELIDMELHTGEHPRLGATDVVPFVPIQGVTITECVMVAKKLAKRIAEDLNIPVYLYENAANTPERQNLEYIRRGEFEGLKAEINNSSERKPDYGPAVLGSAGATVIGARQPLVAYNVYLATDDVAIAKEIAKAIRNSSGGFRYVKAMGLLVDGRAQVSMNLTNYRKTSIHTVVEMIRSLSARYGVMIHHCELIGLIPQQALIDSARWYLQLDDFENNQILEHKLARVQSESETHALLETFADQLASNSPTPGGGSAAAYTGALGAALVAMVARLTVGRKKYANVSNEMVVIVEESERLRSELTAAVKDDAAAFDIYMQALRLPKNTLVEQQTRKEALDKAMLGAAQEPLKVAQKAVRVLELALEVAARGNSNAISDAGSAAAHARAALFAAGLNVRINLLDLPDGSIPSAMLSELTAWELSANSLEKQVLSVLSERGGLFSDSK